MTSDLGSGGSISIASPGMGSRTVTSTGSETSSATASVEAAERLLASLTSAALAAWTSTIVAPSIPQNPVLRTVLVSDHGIGSEILPKTGDRLAHRMGAIDLALHFQALRGFQFHRSQDMLTIKRHLPGSARSYSG